MKRFTKSFIKHRVEEIANELMLYNIGYRRSQIIYNERVQAFKDKLPDNLKKEFMDLDCERERKNVAEMNVLYVQGWKDRGELDNIDSAQLTEMQIDILESA